MELLEKPRKTESFYHDVWECEDHHFHIFLVYPDGTTFTQVVQYLGKDIPGFLSPGAAWFYIYEVWGERPPGIPVQISMF